MAGYLGNDPSKTSFGDSSVRLYLAQKIDGTPGTAPASQALDIVSLVHFTLLVARMPINLCTNVLM